MRIVELSAIAALTASVALPGVFFLACSSNDLAPPAKADAGDAGPAAEAAPPSGEAGTDAEQPPDIYPAQHQPIPQLDFLGGPILDHMKIVTVTFVKTATDAGAGDAGDAGGADAGDAGVDAAGPSGDCTPPPLGDPSCPALRTFDDFIVKSDWWHKTMTGFKVFDGKSGGYRELDDTVSGRSIDDPEIQQMVIDAVAHGRLPAPDAQTLYALYFPASTQISLFGSSSCVEFLGYHSSVFVGAVDAAYAVMPLCKAANAVATREQLTVTASHEFAEAASDPHPGHDPAYYMTTNDAWQASIGVSNAGGENGDVCIFAPNWTEGAYKVQPIWSNQAAMESRDPCQPSPMGALYYGAAVRTTLQTVNKHKSNGYLVLNKGETQDAMIDVFSEKALPHDLKIYAGRDKVGSADPSDMQDIQNGITATFSRREVHNGNSVVMTIAVPAMAVSGNFKFLVRTVLEPSDFHDWPVIVHVN